MTHRAGNWPRIWLTSSGKYRVMGRSLRLPISTSSPSRKIIDRNPSHLGSKLYEPSGISLTALASIGATGGVTGSVIVPCPPTGIPGQLPGPRAARRADAAGHRGTWMEPQAQRLMTECLEKNMIDKDEYPQTAELESRCVNILADLWHAPECVNAMDGWD